MNNNKPGSNGRNGNGSHGNDDKSHNPQDSQRILPPRGNYQTLLSYQKSEVIYEICEICGSNSSL
jgi:hypothetical protein